MSKRARRTRVRRAPIIHKGDDAGTTISIYRSLQIGRCALLWCIRELKEQARRVAKGWSPQEARSRTIILMTVKGRGRPIGDCPDGS
ncbi:MAG: DUF4491 family protein, partial [Synergistaceae bacterium]|nr:DUF4491 family protein [Synergistaceae bacterium]